MHPVEFSFYKFIVLLTSILGISFGITNIVYFNKIRLNNNCNEISTNTATVLIWLNIILVIFSGILFIWSLYRLIFTGKKEKTIIKKQNNIINYPEKKISAEKIPKEISKIVKEKEKPDPFANIYSPEIEKTISILQQYQ